MDYSEIAKRIDHALLSPALTEAELERGLVVALDYDVASVCVLPCYVSRSRAVLQKSAVLTSTTIGFPHGANTVGVKVFEAERALADGAEELDVVVNISQVKSERWSYVRDEIQNLLGVCHSRGKKLKLIFENAYLEDRHKLELCDLATELGVDWVKTSTGFGPSGATLDDVRLMRRQAGPAVQVKASGGIRDLDTVIGLSPFVTRIGTSHTRAILDDCRRRLGLPPVVSGTAPTQ